MKLSPRIARYRKSLQISKFELSENDYLVVLAVLVGLGSGAGVWIFSGLIELFTELLRHDIPDLLPKSLGDWSVPLVLGASGLVVGTIIEKYVGQERHHGVTGILEKVITAGGRLQYRQLPAKALASALSIGAGASLGPEDPSVQIGANLGSFFGQRLNLHEERIRLLVAAGAASAIAAAFNAPLAGIFFAMEVFLREFSTGSFGVIVLASVVSSVFMQSVGGGESELGIQTYELGSLYEIPFYALLGVLAAPVAVAFMRIVYWNDRISHRINVSKSVLIAGAGVIVGTVGIFFPDVLGTGLETMDKVLNSDGGEFSINLLLALVALKILMTSLSMAGGFVGGIFAPSLFVGAMLGGAYGRVIAHFHTTANIGDPAAFAIVGMAALMGGVVRAPITAIILIFELTNDYRMILPILLATIICIAIAERWEPDGIYVRSLRKQGLKPLQGRDIDLMQIVTVKEAMTTPPPTIAPTATLTNLRDAFRDYHTKSLCVVDGDDFIGIVTLADLQTAFESHIADPLSVVVGDIFTNVVVTISPLEPVWRAIRNMTRGGYGSLPVVDEHNSHKLVGLLKRNDIMESYNLAIARKWEEQFIHSQARLHNLVDEDVLEVRIKQESPLAGQRIRHIKWPPGCVVASIRRGHKVVIPQGNTGLRAGDLLIVVIEPEHEPELFKLIGDSTEH